MGKDIRVKVGVSSMEDKMQKARLRWFGYVMKRSVDVLMQKCERLAMDEFRKGKGRMKKYWIEVVRQH